MNFDSSKRETCDEASVTAPQSAQPAPVTDAHRQKRPTGVTALAIIGIALGVFRILSSGISTAVQMVGIQIGDANNPLQEFLENNAAVQTFHYANLGVRLVLAVAMVVVGIGLLRMSEGARRWAVRFALLAILWTIITMAASALFVPRAMELAPHGAERMVFLVLLIIAAVMVFAGAMAYPVASLWYFRKQSVKEKFAQWNDSASSERP